ncbi:MAG: hypothetical protein ACP5SG_08345 [Dissulfurimicrobium sp.]|nr:hypothetical protein [Dissulfurimicrobium hydrothermale]
MNQSKMQVHGWSLNSIMGLAEESASPTGLSGFPVVMHLLIIA